MHSTYGAMLNHGFAKNHSYVCGWKKILKIGQHLTKLEKQKYSGTFFLDMV